MDNIAPTLTADQIREHLVSRAKAHEAATGTKLWAISMQAVNDSKFLANVIGGKNFNVQTYQRVIDWLDQAERPKKGAAA